MTRSPGCQRQQRYHHQADDQEGQPAPLAFPGACPFIIVPAPAYPLIAPRKGERRLPPHRKGLADQGAGSTAAPAVIHHCPDVPDSPHLRQPGEGLGSSGLKLTLHRSMGQRLIGSDRVGPAGCGQSGKRFPGNFDAGQNTHCLLFGACHRLSLRARPAADRVGAFALHHAFTNNGGKPSGTIGLGDACTAACVPDLIFVPGQRRFGAAHRFALPRHGQALSIHLHPCHEHIRTVAPS